MKNVLIFVPAFAYGGVESFVVNYIKRLDLTKFRVDIYALNLHMDSPYESIIKKLGGNVYYDDEEYSSKRVLYFYKKWKTFIKNKNYDVVHANCSLVNAWILLAAKSAGVKILISHSHTTKYGEKGNLCWQGFVTLRRYILNRIATIKFACGKDAGSLYGSNTKFYVLNNCIEYQKYKAPETHLVPLLKEKKLGYIHSHSKVYANISLFSYNKNQLFIIEIFRHILKMQPHALLLLGGPDQSQESQEVVKKLHKKINEYGIKNSVKIMGAVSDMKQYYDIIDCWLFPSFSEGLPITLLELQAASVPIISSKNVTPEANLNLSPFVFLSLDESPQFWADTAIKLSKNPIDDCLIKEAFLKRGYDFERNSHLLELSYLGNIKLIEKSFIPIKCNQ